MKLKSLTLGGFKGIQTTAHLPLAPVTLLFGANSTGKSTILHGLLYLYEILINKNLSPEYSEVTGRKIWLGGFENLVHGKNKEGVITVGAEIELDDIDFGNYFLDPDQEEYLCETVGYSGELFMTSWRFTVEIIWDQFKDQPFVQLFETYSDGELVSRIRHKSGTPSPVMTYLKMLESWLSEIGPIDDKAISAAIDLSNMELSGKSALPHFTQPLSFDSPPWQWEDVSSAEPDDAQACLENAASSVIVGPGQDLCDLIRNLLHIGPIRVIPDDSFILERKQRSERWVDGSAAWDAFAFGSDQFRENVNSPFFYPVDGFGAGYFFEVSDKDHLGRQTVYISNLAHDNMPHRLTEVGVGISQVFPVITAIHLEQDAIVSCEQPELHIHPRWQLVLADMMLKNIKGKHQKLFLMETHSEHLMLRLLKRRRETAEDSLENEALACSKDDVQVIFCESSDGKTLLRPISITDEGEFDAPWPNGFFNERMGELL